VVEGICINISENDQEIAAVMVTVGATQCMTRATSKGAQLRQSEDCGCAIMMFGNFLLTLCVSV
jgi:hypothetical protein